MEIFQCPYLGQGVELTDERARHIATWHSALLPGRPDFIAHALLEPDVVILKAGADDNLVFARWFLELDKYTIVAVITEPSRCCWIITAYISRKLPKGETLWRRRH